jgi:CubicO group peptidase (beta-lactamase class C family)
MGRRGRARATHHPRRLVEQNLPGLSVAVGVGGEIVWAEGFGWADLENRVPVAPNTRFRIGTASSVLTSAAVGRLLENGRLNIDDEIQTYVPSFPAKEWPVTLRCEQTADGLQRFAKYPLLFEPGTQYRYSSYGWVLVSAAVEAGDDEPFFAFMRSRVFEPLGMDETRADTDGPDPEPGGLLLPAVRGRPPLRPAAAGRGRLLLLRRVQRVPLHPVRPGPLRPGNHQRQAAAAGHGPTAPDLAAAGLGSGHRLRPGLGPRDRRAGR